MNTLEEAIKLPGISKAVGGGLDLHFDPLPNWYGCILGFDCPICAQPIDWTWEGGKLPSFTNPASIEASGVFPQVSGAFLAGWGHRWIVVKCTKCGTVLGADNFDNSRPREEEEK